jgi:hypothetical protein
MRAALRCRAEADAQRNLRLAGELLRLLDRFAERGITAVPYKGPVLGALYYGDLALRPFRDLDFLVRPSDRVRAHDVLAAEGYGPSLGLIPRHEAAFRAATREAMFWRDDDIVELHWAFAPPEFPFPLDHDEVWAHLQPVRLGGRVVHTLGTEDLLLYLCAHGAKHAWARLEWICDVAQLVRREPGLNWEAIVTRARARGCERMVLLGLLLARDLLEAPVPEVLLTRARADASVRSLAGLVQSRLFTGPTAAEDAWNARVFQLRVLERWRDRVRFLLRLTFTPSLSDWELVQLPAALSFLYYLIRPVRLAVKYGRLALNRAVSRQPLLRAR